MFFRTNELVEFQDSSKLSPTWTKKFETIQLYFDIIFSGRRTDTTRSL